MDKNEKKDIPAGNPEIDVTKFVNISDEPFDIYIGGKLARHLEGKEEQVLPVWVAQVGAKHLVDRVLQKKGVADSITDTPARQSLFAKILPDMALERDIKPLAEQDEQRVFKEQLAKQEKIIAGLSGKEESRDEKIKQLEDMIDKQGKLIEKLTPKLGRPKKEEEKVAE